MALQIDIKGWLLANINLLSNWNTDRLRKKERLKIYNQYSVGDIPNEDYVKQRKELEERYKEEDKL